MHNCNTLCTGSNLIATTIKACTYNLTFLRGYTCSDSHEYAYFRSEQRRNRRRPLPRYLRHVMSQTSSYIDGTFSIVLIDLNDKFRVVDP